MKYYKLLVFLMSINIYAQLEQNHTFYQYDNLNRLTQVIYNDGTEVNYTYDDLGNRTQTTVASDDDDLTFVPDDAFEQELIDQGFDDVMDDYVVTANISGIVTIDLAGLGIADATGLEDFTALEELIIRFNNLTELDVSENTALRDLNATDNQLTDFVVTGSAMKVLNLGQNDFTTIDVASVPNLNQLSIINNQVSQLDLSNNPVLDLLDIQNNPITELDAFTIPIISTIYADNTEITQLDLSSNSELRVFEMRDGILSSLNLNSGNNQQLFVMETTNNPDLFCIQVDDENAANNGDGNYGDWVIDAGVEYSESCTLNIDDIELSNLLILSPNPTSSDLNITIDSTLSFNINNYEIYDMTGRLADAGKIKMNTNTSTLSVEQLQSGTYILILGGGNQKNIAQRFIKL